MAPKRNRSSDFSSSSSNDENDSKKRALKISKVVSSDSSSSSDDDDGEWNAKPKNKLKKKKQKPTKILKKKVSSDSEEDANASESSVQEKNYFDEKEEGEVDFSDDDNEEFNDGFDENLMGDEEDKRKLSQMTEKEREQELFNRSEKREVLRTRFEIERKLRLAKKQEMKKKAYGDKQVEKNLDSHFIEPSSRSIERRKVIEDKRKVKDAMKGLKAEREKKKLKQKLKATDVYSDSSDSSDSESEVKSNKKTTKKSSSSEDFSSSSSISEDDSDGDSKFKSDARKKDGNDWDNEKFEDNREEEQFNLTIEHLNSIRLSRHKMELWCHAPFFRDIVVGCFVRFGVGNTQGQYIIGQIIEIVETPKIYSLGKTKTNKGIKLKHANDPEKVYRMEYISNSEFNLIEFEKWYNKMTTEKCDLPTKDLIERKRNDILKALNYKYSEKDIEMIVHEKNRFKHNPINFAMKKTLLLKDKEYAEMNGEHEKAIELGREIDRLEEESKKIDKQRTSNIAAISFINERNRMRNIKEAEKAIAEAAKEAQNNKDDPFTRRKCTPTMVHVCNKNKQYTLQNEPQAKYNENDTLDEFGKNKKENNQDFFDPIAKNQLINFTSDISNHKLNNKQSDNVEDANDMFNVHNFDITIDLENFEFNMNNNPNNSTLSNQNASFSKGLLSNLNNSKSNGLTNSRSNTMSNPTSNRRSLNLDEYKKKKGLI